MSLTLIELNNHYDESRMKYDIKGESHLEYYREKFPENYSKLLHHTSKE